MGMFTRDCYDDARDERIAQIGLVAYEAEQKEYQRKYREEHPDEFRWSTTEPKVMYGDVICRWNTKKQIVENEAAVKGVTEAGEIVVRFIDGRYDGQSKIWQGEYRKLCSVRYEKE